MRVTKHGINKKIALFFLLLFSFNVLLLPLFLLPQKADAIFAPDLTGDITKVLNGANPIELAFKLVKIYETGVDVATNIDNIVQDFLYGDIKYTSDTVIQSKYFKYTLNKDCSHDYDCYISDDPISNGLAKLAGNNIFQKFGIAVNKRDRNDAKYVLFTATPAMQLNTGFFAPTMATNIVKKFRADYEDFIHYYVPGAPLLSIGWPITLKNTAAASNIRGATPATVLPPIIKGEIVFPPEEELIPMYMNGLFKDFYVSWGTTDTILGFTAVSYKESERKLIFNLSPQDLYINLYTNTDYNIKLKGGGGTVDCSTGSATIVSPCGVEYNGEITFNLTADGKMKVINPKEGEDINDGKKFSLLESAVNPIWIRGSSKISSPLDKALSATIKWLAGIVETGLSVTMNWVDSLLNETDDYVLGDGSPDSRGVEPAWTKIRNIALTLLVLALIIIAFANVFQVNIEQYGLNRIIPKIIVAIIMAYMSWVFVLFFFDVANVIQAQAYSLLGSGSGLEVLGSVSIATPDSADIMAKIGAIIVLIILLFGVWVCGIVLLFLLLLRIVMLSFLLAIAPLAMIANIMPFTASQYKRWWNEFFKWMFMGPMATAILALGMVIATNTGFGTTTEKFDANIVSDAANPGSGVNLLVGLLIFGASMYMAATLPLKWGGNVMGKWANAGKKLWGNTGGKVVGGASALAGMAGKGIWNNTGGRITQPMSKAWKGYWGQKDLSRDMKNEQAAGALLRKAPGLDDTERRRASRQLEGVYGKALEGADAHALARDFKAAEHAGDNEKMRAIVRKAKTEFKDTSFLMADPSEFNENGSYTNPDDNERKKASRRGRQALARSEKFGDVISGDRDFRNFVLGEDTEFAMDRAMNDRENGATIIRDAASSAGSQNLGGVSKDFIKGLTGEEVDQAGNLVEGARLANAYKAGEGGTESQKELTAAALSLQKRLKNATTGDDKSLSSANSKIKGAYKAHIEAALSAGMLQGGEIKESTLKAIGFSDQEIAAHTGSTPSSTRPTSPSPTNQAPSTPSPQNQPANSPKIPDSINAGSYEQNDSGIWLPPKK